jgi:hypothetical protein
MSKERKKDLLGNIPEIGDIIVFNPPKYKGLVYGECVGFTSTGIPKVLKTNTSNFYLEYVLKQNGYYSPKTEFVVAKRYTQ